MEFLKALERALSLGVTTQEFLPIWNYELTAKLQRNNDTDNARKSIDGIMIINAEHLQKKLKNELQQFILDTFEQQVDKMSEDFEQKWKEQLNQLELGSDSHVRFLSHSNCDTAGSGATSPCPVVKQNTFFIKPKVQTMEQKGETPVFESYIQNNLCESSQAITESSNFSQEVVDVNINENVCRSENKRLKESSYTRVLKSLAKQSSSLIKALGKSTKTDKHARFSSNHSASDTLGHPTSDELSTVTTQIWIETSYQCMLIPSQGKCQSPVELGDGDKAPTKTNLASCDIRKKDSSSNEDDQETVETIMRYIPKKFAAFTIFDSDLFVSSRKYFVTPFYYTESETCKVRFCIHFDSARRMNVSLLVSNGRVNDSETWPLSLTCAGYVYKDSFHVGPAKPQIISNIWSLGPVECKQPEQGQEIRLKAVVCLRTSIREYQDVKYKILRRRKYACQNRLLFDWEMTVSSTE